MRRDSVEIDTYPDSVPAVSGTDETGNRKSDKKSTRLTPPQQEIIDQLGAPRRHRPEFGADSGRQLRQALDDNLGPLLEELRADETLRVSKYLLNTVFGCERRFMAVDGSPFEWSAPTARGSIVHKAIEIMVNSRREPYPSDVVDDAMDRLGENADGLGDFLRSCTATERSELRAEAVERVTRFSDCFPPLEPRWRPVTETRLRYEHPSYRMVMSGRPDLALGRPDGTVAGRVLFDFKTGSFSPTHRDDLRLYALMEAMAVLPPRLLVTYYLDQGKFMPEEVTEDLLYSTVARIVAGTERIIQLRKSRREPDVIPGPACRWCPVRPDCEEGLRYLDEDSGDDFTAWAEP